MVTSRYSSRLVLVTIIAISFGILFVRGRPIGVLRTAEPVLYASGLTQPRGLAFGADGLLYVAEAGVAGPGERTASGRLSRYDFRERQTVLLDGLGQASALQPLFVQAGPGALIGGQVQTVALPFPFTLTGSTGEAPYGRLNRLRQSGGDWQMDAIAALADAPVAAPASPWGGAVTTDGSAYVAVPLANVLVRLPLSPAGGAAGPPAVVTSFVDSGQRNPLPTSVAIGPDGAIYVSLFGAEPYRPGGGRVVRVEPDGRWAPVFDTLTFPVAIAFAPDGQLFVLELASTYDDRGGTFAPRTGRLLLVGPSPSRRRTVTREISYPTALAVSPAGDVFVTESGVFSGAGAGRVLQVPAQTLRLLR